MVRNRKRKTCNGLHSEKDMAEAILMVEGGLSLRKAANKNNIKFATLQRYVQKKRKCSEQEAKHLRLTPDYTNRTVFSVDQENTLHEYIVKCSRVSDGIDTVEFRKLAYEMAVYYNLKIPKNWEANKMAGIEWFYGFRKRLIKSLRKSEPGSLTPETSLNRQNADDTDCSKKWCHKRDYYVRRRRGKPGTRSSGEAASNRADLLSFLDSLPSTQKNTFTNAVDEDPKDTIVTIMDNTDDSSERTQTLEDGAIKRENTRDSEETQSNTQEIEFFICDNSDDNEHDKAKTRTYDYDGLAEIHKQKIAQNELDENDLFFSSMAKIIKKLPRYEQAQLRLQIGSLVGNAELSHISSNHAESSDDGISCSK